jgi:hypothetical protein
MRGLGHVFLFMFFILSAIPAFAQVYQYRDQNGQLHFTNNLSEVPEGQQPEILMKPPNRAAEPEEGAVKTPVKGSPETGKAAVPSKETPKRKDGKKPPEIPIVEDLNNEKAALDRIHARLMKRKKGIKKEKQTLKTPDQVRQYRKKVSRLNTDIDAYKKRNRAFQKKADAYNAAVREKGEE